MPSTFHKNYGHGPGSEYIWPFSPLAIPGVRVRYGPAVQITNCCMQKLAKTYIVEILCSPVHIVPNPRTFLLDAAAHLSHDRGQGYAQVWISVKLDRG